MTVRLRRDRAGRQRPWVDCFLGRGRRVQKFFPGSLQEAKAWERRRVRQTSARAKKASAIRRTTAERWCINTIPTTVTPASAVQPSVPETDADGTGSD